MMSKREREREENRVRIDGGWVQPPTSTFQTHYFSKNIDLIDKNLAQPPTLPFDNSTTGGECHKYVAFCPVPWFTEASTGIKGNCQRSTWILWVASDLTRSSVVNPEIDGIITFWANFNDR